MTQSKADHAYVPQWPSHNQKEKPTATLSSLRLRGVENAGYFGDRFLSDSKRTYKVLHVWA